MDKKFIRVDKKRNILLFDMPGLGTAEIRNDPKSMEVSAIVRHNGQEEKAGFIRYYFENGQVKISSMFVNEKYRRNNLATIMSARLQALFPHSEIVHTNVVEKEKLPYRVAETLGQKVENEKTFNLRGLGKVVLKNTQLGQSGEVNAVIIKNGKSQPAGWLAYNILKKEHGLDRDQIRVSHVSVPENLQNKGIATKMLSFLESHSDGKDVVLLDVRNPKMLRIAEKMKYEARKDPEEGMWGIKRVSLARRKKR